MYLNNKVFIEAWLDSLNIVLKDTRNNIKSMEENQENNRPFADMQIKLIMNWLTEENLQPEVRGDLEGVLANIKNREHKNMENLKSQGQSENLLHL